MISHDDPFADFGEDRTSEPIQEEKDTDDTGEVEKFSEDVFSRTLKTRSRTFFFDLKKSVNGKFLKISERYKGKKSTIMMDAADIAGFIDAMNAIRNKL
jgi:hypothetical protein